MANKKKIDTATEADWGFVNSAEVMAAAEFAARKAAREFELVEFDDAQQDAYLYLAVRPERVAQAHAELDYRSLAQDIYANALRAGAVGESDNAVVTDSLEALQERAVGK